MAGAQMKQVATALVLACVLALALLVARAWRNHTVHGHIEQALGAAEAAKLVVMEAATMHGGVADLRASQLGFNNEAASNPFVARLDVGDGGRITLFTRATGASPDPVLELVPRETGDAAAPLEWTCRMTRGDATWVPQGCATGSGTH